MEAHWIAGRLMESSSKDILSIMNPATEKQIVSLHSCRKTV